MTVRVQFAAFLGAYAIIGHATEFQAPAAKLTVVADYAHRLDSSRAAALELLGTLRLAHPNQKGCVFLESTPQIHDVWAQFKNSDGSHAAFDRAKEPLVHRTGSDIATLSDAVRRHQLLDLQYFMASAYRDFKNIDVFGIDFDYTGTSAARRLTLKKVYNVLTGNADHVPPEEAVDLALTERREVMCANIRREFSDQFCDYGMVIVGSEHVVDFEGDPNMFPGYQGPVIEGIPSCLKAPATVHLTMDDRVCEVGDPASCRLNVRQIESGQVVLFPRNFQNARELAPVGAAEDAPTTAR